MTEEQSEKLSTVEARNLNQEELGEVLANLAHKGMIQPTLLTRLEEMAVRLKDRFKLADEIEVQVRIVAGEAKRWAVGVGNYVDDRGLWLDCRYDETFERYRFKVNSMMRGASTGGNTWHMPLQDPDGVVNGNPGEVIAPTPENVEKMVIEFVKGYF